MGRKEASSRSRVQSNRRSTNEPTSGIVTHVILDIDDDLIPEINDSETNPRPADAFVGHAAIKKHGDTSSNVNEVVTYAPYDLSNGLPLVGETVSLIKVGSNLYYMRIPNRDLNLGNAQLDKDLKLAPSTEDAGSSAENYSEISQTKTPTASSTGDDRKTKLGNYFEPTDINPLKLYEGDQVIQSRFGQSIRFSAYNNDGNIFSPTIILRNGQNAQSLSKLEKNELTEEDVNRDGSIIALTSNNYKLNFQPGIVDDGGNTDFKTNSPINANISEPDGLEQVLINSERITLSSKTDKMLFFSKGEYGCISDGRFTIDNGEAGADLDFGGDVNITTDKNAGNVFINTGDGNILLNTTETSEPLVRGQQLVDILSELIDKIKEQVFNTPAGPTAVGPVNVGDFDAIQSKLDTIKSTLNFTE